MRIDDGKRAYEDAEIPEELHSMVEGLIKEDRKKRTSSIEGQKNIKDCKASEKYDEKNIISINRERRKHFMLKRTAAAAAAVLVLFTAGVNTNEAFAETAASIPVIGELAKVLTVRSYHSDEGDFNINMEVPGIETSGAAGASITDSEFTGRINDEIKKITDEYTQQAKNEFEEYKKAFFETGGTEEEWNNRQMDITIDYDIKYQENPILSLELTTAKGWVAASEERHYYNLDLSSDRRLSLKDVLGDDWKNICNTEVDRQIKEQISSDNSLSYFGYGDNELTAEKFTSVDENTGFYINSDKKVVLVFPEYSIAPGYMGIREFVVGNALLS